MFDRERAKQQWLDQVYNNPAVDPREIYCWDSLAYGFALALGATVDEAKHFELNWDKY